MSRFSFLGLFKPGRGPVKGEGPLDAECMIVGESPGKKEAWKNRPFIGKTGEVLDGFLDGVNLPSRDSVYITNVCKYYDEHREYSYGPTAEEKAWLLEELEAVQPRLIVALGRPAARFFLGDVDIEDVQGIAWRPKHDLSLPGDAVVFAIVHPAAGFHNPEMSAWVTYGFGQLAAFIEGDSHARTLFDDPYPTPHYEEITTSSQLGACLSDQLSDRAGCVAIDTEGSPRKPWSLQFCLQAGTAYLIRAARRDLLTRLRRHLVDMGARVAFHNALHDLGMMRAMGIPWDGPFDDTMVAAYLLQVEPQGLKPLCVRHCGMKMQSYDDVMGNASTSLARDYLWSLFDIEQLDWEARCQAEFEARKAAGRRVKVVPKLPRGKLHKAVERCLQSREPRRLWTKQIDDEQHSGKTHLGPMWEASLDNVDPQLALWYACRDADGTRRLIDQLVPRLRAMGLYE